LILPQVKFAALLGKALVKLQFNISVCLCKPLFLYKNMYKKRFQKAANNDK